jgi:hypothetical protein
MDVSPEMTPVYSYLGLALYQAQALEYTLVNLYAETARNKEWVWSHRLQQLLDERQEHRICRSLEDLLADLDLPTEFLPKMNVALLERNWLLHQFYHEQGKSAYDSASATAACARLKKVSEDLGILVLDLNSVLFDRQLQGDVPDTERKQVDLTVRRYIQHAELF